MADKKKPNHLEEWTKMLNNYQKCEQTQYIEYRIQAIKRLIATEEAKH